MVVCTKLKEASKYQMQNKSFKTNLHNHQWKHLTIIYISNKKGYFLIKMEMQSFLKVMKMQILSTR